MISKLVQFLKNITLGGGFIALLALFMFLILYNQMVHTIPVGHTSVLWHRIHFLWDSVSEGPIAEGIKVILPWDKLYTYDLRLQTNRQNYQVVSKDGLHFELAIFFRWQAVRENIINLNQSLGPDYVQKLLIPEIGSTTREVAAHYTAEDLYTKKRVDVQQKIFDTVTNDAIKNGIVSQHLEGDHDDVVVLHDILIETVKLPIQIKKAVENKLEQAQIAQEYLFRLKREKLESQRKSIEAEGIRNFQKLITSGITDSYLKWRGIEATLKLAESSNSKVVIIGNSETGLPLILDTKTPQSLHIKGNEEYPTPPLLSPPNTQKSESDSVLPSQSLQPNPATRDEVK